MRRVGRWGAALVSLVLGFLCAACSPAAGPPPAEDATPRPGGRFVFPLRA